VIVGVKRRGACLHLHMTNVVVPLFVKVHISGEALTQKCWLVQTNEVPPRDVLLWEFRRVLDCAWGHSIEVHRFLKKNKPMFVKDLALAGLAVDTEIFPSARAWRALHPNRAPPPYLQDEYSVSSEALITMLSCWSSGRRMEAHRVSSKALLKELISRGVASEDAKDAILSVPPKETLEKCVGFVEAKGSCDHIEKIYGAVLRSEGTEFHLLSELAISLFAIASECPAIVEWLSTWVPAVAESLVAHVPDAFQRDILTARPEALNGKGKKRRLDSDLKQAIVMEAMTKRLAHTPGSFVVANGTCARSTAAAWTPLVLGQYRAACMLSLNKPPVLALTWDASRVG
jgi:hypothetical protein